MRRGVVGDSRECNVAYDGYPHVALGLDALLECHWGGCEPRCGGQVGRADGVGENEVRRLAVLPIRGRRGLDDAHALMGRELPLRGHDVVGPGRRRDVETDLGSHGELQRLVLGGSDGSRS